MHRLLYYTPLEDNYLVVYDHYMINEMKEHQRLIEARMSVTTLDNLATLVVYHRERMRDFQHERLIHLLVMSLVTLLTVFIYYAGVVTDNSLFFLLEVVLIPLLFAYIIHYRRLENGVQNLYSLTKKLFEASASS